MRRLTTTAILAALLLLPVGAASSGAESRDEDVVLRINEFRMTRGEFEREINPQGLHDDRAPGQFPKSLKPSLLREVAEKRLLGLYAERHIFPEHPVWEASIANIRDEYLGRKWLEAQLKKGGDKEETKRYLEKVLREIEKKRRVRRIVPMRKDGDLPPDSAVVARIGKEEIRFSRVRAMAARGYAAYRNWPTGVTDESLSDALENVIRFRLLALEAQAQPKYGKMIESDEFRNIMRDFAIWVAGEKVRYEADQPGPEFEAELVSIRAAASKYFPVLVQVLKGKNEKDLGDMKLELSGIPSGSTGVGSRVEGIKQDGRAEFWPRAGFLPKELETAILDAPPGAAYTPIIRSGESYYVARIFERKEPPPGLAAAAEKDALKRFRDRRYQEFLKEMVDQARSENRVEIHEDIL